jgi:hypothetical protein
MIGVSGANIDAALAALVRQAEGGGRPNPPVHLWNPPDCGESRMEIRADGSWWHEGVRIGRPSLVRLFASILRRDPDGEVYLVTPVEKMRVRIEDAPFVAIRADRLAEGAGQSIAFTTNVGDVVEASAETPLRVAEDGAAPRPYIMVRPGLEARILRAPFYELADWGEVRDQRMVLRSRGVEFDLGAVA